MPTSDLHNITPILSVITALQPRSVLDIGCGFGKYGALMREYLDVWHERTAPQSWKVRLTAIDAYGPYRNPIWDYVYQEIHIGEARGILPTLDPVDVILIADVIEHLERPAAVELVEKSLEKASVLIISTPREFYAQKGVDNPYETHHIVWTEKDFPTGFHVVTIPLMSCNLYVASRSPLSREVTYLADLRNVLFLHSRYKLRKLGPAGWVLASLLRALSRWLA